MPRFDGSNYTFWKIRMEECLQYLAMDISNSVENGYKFTTTNSSESEEIDENEHITPRTVQVNLKDRR